MKVDKFLALHEQYCGKDQDAVLFRVTSDKWRTFSLLSLTGGYYFVIMELGLRSYHSPGITRVPLLKEEFLIFRRDLFFLKHHPDLSKALMMGLPALKRLPSVLLHPGASLRDTSGCLLVVGDRIFPERFSFSSAFDLGVDNTIALSNASYLLSAKRRPPELSMAVVELDIPFNEQASIPMTLDRLVNIATIK